MSTDVSYQTERRGSMTHEDERERRASIQAIMRDTNLTPAERRRSIQSLMDGRRRSSTLGGSTGPTGSVAAAAAAVAEDLGSLTEDDDDDNVIPEDGVVAVSPSAHRRYSLRSSSFRSRRSSRHGSFHTGSSPSMDPLMLSRKLEKSRPPCGHYHRNCSIVAPCCGLVFGCRICHDDAPELPPPLLRSSDSMEEETDTQQPPSCSAASFPSHFDDEEETHHNIDRFAISEIICRECYTRQSSKTNNCISCNVQFGSYHCRICNLWMSSDEDPYHCDQCGFCRVGGRENFKHCNECGMCIDALLFGDHNCKSGKYMSNCPVCQEDLFSSRMASHEMPCGHAIHWHCFTELTSFDTRCPVCKKTAETHDQMEQTWAAIAMGIALQPVPPDMARVVNISCNDCEKKGTHQRWHFLGVQCQFCTGFNTTVDETVMTGPQAADYLGPAPAPPANAELSAGGVDHNVLSALMDHSGEVLRGVEQRSNDMETEESNQAIAAEVLGMMNNTNNTYNLGQSMTENMEQDIDENEEDESL